MKRKGRMRNTRHGKRHVRRCAVDAAPHVKVFSDTEGGHLPEDLEDLAAFDERANQPNLAFEEALKGLRSRRKRRPQR